MLVRYGSRTIEIETPANSQEWHQATGFHFSAHSIAAMEAVFKAGALAALKTIEQSRGARREELLLSIEERN